MFSKNMKILSLFLVLAVVMIGALGAVSAATATADGNATADVTGTDNNAISQGNSGASTATGTISGDYLTNTTNADKTVTTGSAVNSTGTDPDTLSAPSVTFSGVYSTDNGTLADGTTSQISGVTIDTTGATTNVTKDGTFTSDVTLNKVGLLENGNTYYLKTTIAAANAFSADGTKYAAVAQTDNYVPFTYSGNSITLNQDTLNVTYGDDWTFTGTLTDENGTTIKNTQVIVKIGTKEVTINTGSTGIFEVGTGAFGNLDVGTNLVYFYAVSATAPTASTIGNLTVNKKTVTLDADVTNSTSPFGTDNKILVSIYDGKTLLSFTDKFHR
jgi:hypothetical protein